MALFIWYKSSHPTDKCKNFKRFARGRIVKGEMSLMRNKQIQILELTNLNGLLRYRIMQERRPIPA